MDVWRAHCLQANASRRFGFIAALFVAGCSFVTVNGPTSSDPRCLSPAATTSRAAPLADIMLGAGGVAFAAFVANKDLEGEGPGRGLGTIVIGLPSLMVGATYLASAYYGFREVGRCRALAEPAADPAARAWRVRAKGLTRAAAVAARGGDCASVVLHSSKLKQFDPEFHATVFMQDVAIRRCLETPPSPAAPEPPADLSHDATGTER